MQKSDKSTFFGFHAYDVECKEICFVSFSSWQGACHLLNIALDEDDQENNHVWEQEYSIFEHDFWQPWFRRRPLQPMAKYWWPAHNLCSEYIATFWSIIRTALALDSYHEIESKKQGLFPSQFVSFDQTDRWGLESAAVFASRHYSDRGLKELIPSFVSM